MENYNKAITQLTNQIKDQKALEDKCKSDLEGARRDKIKTTNRL